MSIVIRVTGQRKILAVKRLRSFESNAPVLQIFCLNEIAPWQNADEVHEVQQNAVTGKKGKKGIKAITWLQVNPFYLQFKILTCVKFLHQRWGEYE